VKIANIFLLDRPSRGGLSFIRTYTIVQATSIDKWTRKLRPRNCRGVAGCDRSESRPRQEIRFRTHALRLRRARIHLDFKRRPEDDARIPSPRTHRISPGTRSTDACGYTHIHGNSTGVADAEERSSRKKAKSVGRGSAPNRRIIEAIWPR